MVTLDDRSATIPLEDIWVVIVESHLVTLTVACMSQLNDAGIGIMICGRDHMPNGLMLPLGAHSRHARIVEDQLAMTLPFKNNSGNESSRPRFSTKPLFLRKWVSPLARCLPMQKTFSLATRITARELPRQHISKHSLQKELAAVVCKARRLITAIAFYAQVLDGRQWVAVGSFRKGFIITVFTTPLILSMTSSNHIGPLSILLS